MCLAVPARVVQLLPGDEAVIDLDGVRKRISLALVDGVAEGDYVIVHVGYALQRLDPDEAARTLDLFRQAGLPAGAGS
jgi:hydrogenase expression/formation protein HypC